MSTLVVGRSDRNTSGRLARFLQAAANQVVARYTTWKNRRAVADLLDFDSRMLADIGVTRGDVVSALSMPGDRDPSTRLVVLAVERRAARVAMHQELAGLEKNRGAE